MGEILKRLWIVLSVGWAACVLIAEALATHPPGWSGPGPIQTALGAGLPFIAGTVLWLVGRFVVTGRWTAQR